MLILINRLHCVAISQAAPLLHIYLQPEATGIEREEPSACVWTGCSDHLRWTRQVL